MLLLFEFLGVLSHGWLKHVEPLNFSTRQVQVLASGMMDLMTKHSAFLSLRSAMREGNLVPFRELLGSLAERWDRRWRFDTMRTHGNVKHHDFFDGCDIYIYIYIGRERERDIYIYIISK